MTPPHYIIPSSQEKPVSTMWSPQVYLEGKFGEKPGVDFIQRPNDAVMKTGWPWVVEPVIRGIVWLRRPTQGPTNVFLVSINRSFDTSGVTSSTWWPPTGQWWSLLEYKNNISNLTRQILNSWSLSAPTKNKDKAKHSAYSPCCLPQVSNWYPYFSSN